MNKPRHPNRPDAPQADEEFDWERGLENLRRRRAGQEPAAPAKAAPQSAAPARPSAPTPSRPTEKQLNARAAEKVLREYLQQWQQEHNDLFDDAPAAETDTTVLLQEDWLAAQTALQSARTDDKHIEGTRTVWLNPKRQTVAFSEPEGLRSGRREETHPDGQAGQEPSETAWAEDAFAVAPEEEWLPVTVKLINPQADPRKPVMTLSEQELLERLSRRLRPHLTDAVAGMVRVAVQKHTAALTYQLQQLLNEQTPALVDEILDYNLKAALSEIKYSLKYKR